jgi:CheY-like chemotaxis protein
MPDQDGYDLLRQVREFENPQTHTPAVAVTAYARTGDKERALAAGFAAHISKPMSASELLDVVGRLVRQQGGPVRTPRR